MGRVLDQPPLVVLVPEGLARVFVDDLSEPLVEIAALWYELLERAEDPEGQVLHAVDLEALVPEAVHEVFLAPMILGRSGEGTVRDVRSRLMLARSCASRSPAIRDRRA